MWYDVNKTLTHNAMINIIIGPRGFGKTYGLKKKAVQNFIKDGSQFIYLRRYDSELKLVKDNLFDDLIVNNDFPFTLCQCEGDQYIFDGELAGYAIALSRSNYYKSASFPFVKLIIFDEFIIDTTQNLRYLNNEVRKMLDFIETVARMRENVKVFLLANSLSFVNPYTLYWDIKMPKGKRFSKAVDGIVLCELVGDEEFREKKKETVFGKLNAGTEYERMSVQNEFILDNDTFIEKRPGNSRYAFCFTYNGHSYGVWFDPENGKCYISTKVDPSGQIVYAIKTDDHNDTTHLLKGARSSLIGQVVSLYKRGAVRFETIQIKAAFMEILKKVMC